MEYFLAKCHPIEIRIGTYIYSYGVVSTSASKAYDYAATIEIYDAGDHRIVIVPMEYIEKQVKRYMTSLDPSCDIATKDDHMNAYVANMLMKKLLK